MTIERRIQSTAGVLFIFILGLGLILFWESNQVAEGIERMSMNSQVLENAFMLKILTDEYLGHGEKRALREWHQRKALLDRLLQIKALADPNHRVAIETMQEDSKNIQSLFSKLTDRGTSVEDQAHDANHDEYRAILIGMLSVDLEKVAHKASQLNRSWQGSTIKKQQWAQHIILAVVIVMFMIILINQYLIRKSVLRPLQILAGETRSIADGNFKPVLHLTSDDEMGELAKSFNTMIERLETSYTSLTTEINERKQAQEHLIRSNKDLEQFAYVASHDLQEPLRNVASCLQMLEKKYKNQLDADADQYIYYAVDSAVRMKALIQDLLAYSRIGTQGKAPAPTDCERILAEAVNNLRSAITETGAVITHDSLPTVAADDTQLLQVFQNLIGNAIKFRRDEQPQIHVSAVENKNEWVFSVKDNGIGIESKYLDRIFVIFQRLHKRTEYEGTGMGLAIVKKVVERHGGGVWVESEPGVGATFYFTIPEKGIR